MKYEYFLFQLDKKLSLYFEEYKEYINCKIGCSSCCEKGDYPISQLELEYLMQGYIALNNELKQRVQTNVKQMVKGGACPFLVDNKCSVYSYRPVVCRVHGLAYLYKNKSVKLPYCANLGKNFSKVFANDSITIDPILENLDTPNLLKDFDYGEIRNLIDWLNK